MQKAPRDMVVGRDRAHVRNLIVEHPHQEVMTASQFFDKLRLFAFLKCPELVRDDYAPLIFAQRILARERAYPFRYAKNFASLYGACVHGVSWPHEVQAQLGPDDEKLATVFAILSQIDASMKEHHLVTGVTSLFIARELLRRERGLPPYFAVGQKITLVHLVDLTMLEIEVIKELARLGVNFDICFPLDFAQRGINAAVDFSASCFERDSEITSVELVFETIGGDGALQELVDHLFTENHLEISGALCSMHQAASITAEADHVAHAIADVLSRDRSKRIALVMRTMDTRSRIFQQSVRRHGISVRDRKGVSLAKTKACILLSTMISARQWGLVKRDLIGLLHHPLFVAQIQDMLMRSRVIDLVNDLGIDDRIVQNQQGFDRYRERVKILAGTSSTSLEQTASAREFLEWLDKVEPLLGLMPERAGLHEFLKAVLALIEQAMDADDTSVIALKNAITDMTKSRAFLEGDPVFELRDLSRWLLDELAVLTVPSPDHPDFNAVELLLLPELLGRQFDHVFIVDMAFGRLPHIPPPDVLLDDRERIHLNRIMKKPLLRIYLDDPFEPMPTPPRQALEPFWFATAIASAQQSVHFSYAERDESEQEQGPSEFFTWLREHIQIVSEEKMHVPRFVSVQQQRLLQGFADKKQMQGGLYQRALNERKRGFTEDKVGDFFFSLNASMAIDAFGGRLGPDPSLALSPTMIEAFAQCRLRGFLSRIVGFERNAVDADDIDARSIGEIAHKALELFFDAHSGDSGHGAILYQRVSTAVDQAMQIFTTRNYVGNKGVLVCHHEWLTDALVTLIGDMEQFRINGAATTIFKEIDFGLSDRQRPPLRVRGGARDYLLGGRVDRIDKTDEGILIIDYKLSSIDKLKAKLSPRKLLKGNFQAPIYLRLAAHHLAHGDRRRVAFAFASIRDGEMLEPLRYEGNEAIFDLIFDDSSEASLAQEIDVVFSRVSAGEIPAHKGEHCANCDFAFLCRRGEWEDYEHEILP